MRKTLLVVLLLAATAAVAATPDSSSQAVTSTPAIRHYLMPDHSIKNVFPDLLPKTVTLAPQADNLAAGPSKEKRILPVQLRFSMHLIGRLRRLKLRSVHHLLCA